MAGGNPYTTGALATFAAAQVAYGEVAADGGTGIYVAVGSANQTGGYSNPAYRTSTDGVNWSETVLFKDSTGTPLGGYLSSIAFGSGRFVLVGNGNGNPAPNADGLIGSSADGVNWTLETNADRPGAPHPQFSEVARSDTNLLCRDQHLLSGYWTSSDGVAWTKSTTGPGFDHIAAFENNFIAGPVQGAAGGVVAVSTDNGNTWNRYTALTNATRVTSVGAGRVLKNPVSTAPGNRSDGRILRILPCALVASALLAGCGSCSRSGSSGDGAAKLDAAPAPPLPVVAKPSAPAGESEVHVFVGPKGFTPNDVHWTRGVPLSLVFKRTATMPAERSLDPGPPGRPQLAARGERHRRDPGSHAWQVRLQVRIELVCRTRDHSLSSPRKRVRDRP